MPLFVFSSMEVKTVVFMSLYLNKMNLKSPDLINIEIASLARHIKIQALKYN